MNLVLLFLIGIGITSFFVVQRLSSVTRTPTWLLWLVGMTPAFIWIGWILVNGNERLPAQLIFISSIICLVLSWLLIQWGRIAPPPSVKPSPVQEDSEQPVLPPADAVSEPGGVPPMDKSEETWLQNCFPWSVYYLQNIEYRPQTIICRGQLRSKPEVAYQTIRENVTEKFGDRFIVFFQEDPNKKPVFVLVPNPEFQGNASDSSTKRAARSLTRPGLALGLLAATFFTTALAWTQIIGKPAPFSWATLMRGVPYAASLLLILGVHELGHYMAARRYRIQATLPYFIPVLPMSIFPFGTFGAFIQVRSPIPNRRALFDVGIAGPFAGFIVALPLLLWGLAHSSLVKLPQNATGIDFQALDPSFSLLLSLLSKLALGSDLTPETAIKLHPVAVASCLGMVVTAFNLMPVGQLDGGHIVHAMFGQRPGAAIGQLARLLLLLLAFAQRQLPYLMVWAIILFLIPTSDEPALNDVSELDDRRDLWGVLAIALLVLIILPTPPFLSHALNI
jgi:membrane-associated protease RseP (regulator of RpoE activity)